MTAEFRRAVSEVAEEDWHVLHKPGSNRVETGQEWAGGELRTQLDRPLQEQP